jgi:hypothetical protein
VESIVKTTLMCGTAAMVNAEETINNNDEKKNLLHKFLIQNS